MDKFEVLKTYYGYDTFREGQEALIDAFMTKDVLGIMPTGGGKSLCYQIPALTSAGVTLVISPLIALMKDQVDGLNEMGISATYLNSTLTSKDQSQRIEAIKAMTYKLVYVAPERLLTESFYQLCQSLEIDRIAVDEAHCISQWGHDFRPSYKNIPLFINRLAKRPIVGAYTATATTYVIEEIKALLDLRDPYTRVTGFDRENLFYKVIKPTDPYKYLRGVLQGTDVQGSSIVYCSTRKTVDSLVKKLSNHGFSVAGYHAGMTHEDRSRVQEAFMLDDIKVIVATNAFGMGIDKPDVRQVIHYNMPQNMEAYYQEAGRGGRDGLPTVCILMYSPSDVVKQRMFMQENQVGPERYKIQLANLQTLVNYCHSDTCLRQAIQVYFGEHTAGDKCGSCGNCLNDSVFVDMTVVAQKILSCVYRTHERYGVNTVIQVLRGSKQKRIIDLGLDKVSTYGIETDYSEGGLREVVMTLIARGYLHLTVDAYPVLKLDERSRAVLKGQVSIRVRQERMVEKKSKTQRVRKSDLAYDKDLFELLLAHRKALATEKNVPLYVVFSNAVLEELAFLMPQKAEEFLDIKGIGQKKFDTYGPGFMKCIQEYMADKGLESNYQEKTEVAYVAVEKSDRDRYEWTYDLYQENLSLADLAQKRGLTVSTIIKHLLKLEAKGYKIDLRQYLDPQKDQLVQEAIEAVGSQSLKALKDWLGEDVTYGDIELTLAILLR